MADLIVVGLFPTKGEAENASHRVVSEGANETDVTVRMLRKESAPPKTMAPELDTLSLDPFFWFLGDLSKDYAGHTTNGETAVSVSVGSRSAAEAVEALLLMFEPKRVDIVSVGAQGEE